MRKLDIHMPKKGKKHFLIPHTKLTKYIIDISINAKDTKLLEQNMRANLCWVYITAEWLGFLGWLLQVVLIDQKSIFIQQPLSTYIQSLRIKYQVWNQFTQFFSLRTSFVKFTCQQLSPAQDNIVQPIQLFSELKKSCMLSYFSRVQLCTTLWIPGHQDLLSIDFPGKKTGGLPFPPPGTFLTQKSNSHLLHILYWQVDFTPLVPPGRPNRL